MKTKHHSLASILLAVCAACPCAPALLQAQPLPDLPFNSGSSGADGPFQMARSTPPLFCHAMAYDNARQQTVVFGGRIAGETTDGTWVWSGGDWEQKLTLPAPAGRYYHSMVFDDARSEIIMVGGQTITGTYFRETWAWNGTNWIPRSSGGPSARVAFGLAYDQTRQQVVLFGGYDGGFRNDTWLWNGTNWIQATPQVRPGTRLFCAMIYDAARQKIVMFGGIYGFQNNDILGDTWTWNGTNWNEEHPNTSPSVRAVASMAYDAERQEVVLFGGESSERSSGYGVGFNDTWVWNGTNWFRRQPAFSPPRRWCSGLAYDSQTKKLVLVDGTSAGANYQDTWLWDGTNWEAATGWFDMRARANGIWNFTTINVPANQSVRFIKNTANTPVRWLASSNVTIAGSIYLDGDFGAPIPYDLPAPGGPGGFNGGVGGGPFNASGSFAGAPGDGPGGGVPGTNQSAGGFSAKYATAPYGNAFLQPLIGGSGGGGGASTPTARGGRGGGGGGAILISSSRDMTIDGLISARGGTGETSEPGGGGGGAGSGGAIRVVADRLTVGQTGMLDVRGDGRIRLESYFRTIAVVTNLQGSNVIGFPVPEQPFNMSGSALRITSVAGQNVAQPPTGDPLRPDVIFSAAGDITVTLQADGSIPNGTPVKLRVATLGSVINKPAAGEPAVVLNGGTATFTLTVPKGNGTIQATAEFMLASP